MRLTLRNLLLYLDHQMAPGDAEDFAEKVKQSEFATGLIERIRSVTRVRRMPAPKLDDKGLGGDANSIADYIENLLPQERIKEFDKLCLDSDMTLAEVASCHHILTLVLAQPVQPSDELRDRIYAIPQLAATTTARAEQAHAAEHPEPPAVAPPLPAQEGADEVAAALAGKSETSEVPDYLRAGRTSGFWPIAATVAATFLIVALLLRSMGPFDNRHPLAKWLGAEASPEVVGGNGNAQAPGPVSPVEPAPDATLEQPADPGEKSSESPQPLADAAPPAPAETLPPQDSPEESEKPNPIPAVAANVPAGDVPDSKMPAKTETPKESEPTEPAKPEEAVPSIMEVGRYISDEQLLGRFDPKMAVWMRVPPRALLVADEPLISFPAFRPQIALGAGVQITLAGEAAIRVLAPDAEGAPRLFVDYGRLLVVTDGKPGTRLALNLAGLEGVLSFTSPGAEIALEVHYFLPPGADPETAHGPRVIEISVLSGEAKWQEPDVDAVTIPANHAFTFVEKSVAEVRGPFKAPDWIDSRTAASNLDRDTRIMLDQALGYERSLNLSLEERAEDRKVEVRSLAARCLIDINRFGPALVNLRDPRLMSFWTYDAEALRAALARSPTTASLIRKEIQGSREMDAALLYRLLVGYSPEQLAADGANELIESLEHPELDVRVLAFDNLWRITGAMFNYRPERKPELNRTAVLRFRERLKEGSLAYKAIPSPLPERKPLTK